MFKYIFRNLVIVILFLAFNICAQCAANLPIGGNLSLEKAEKLTNLAKELQLAAERLRTDTGNLPKDFEANIFNNGYFADTKNILTNQPMKHVPLGAWSPGDMSFLVDTYNHAYLVVVYDVNKESTGQLDGYKGILQCIYESDTPDQDVVIIDHKTNKKYNSKSSGNGCILTPLN